MKVAEAAGCPVLVGDIAGLQLPDGKVYIVTDENVAKHVSAGIAGETFVVPPGEKSKSQEQLFALLQWLASSGADRGSLIVAIGGGVVGDLAGFAAATYMRGIRWVNVATSLLAQVDAAIGGKTAVDLPEGKNLAGAFHMPELVWSDVAFLSSLPDEHFRNGMAEVIKTAVVLDATFVDWLVEHHDAIMRKDTDTLTTMVTRCAQLKSAVVTEDPREETGRRAVLNFGHTVGHAIEAAMGYEGLLHGEAVMIGMMVEATAGVELELTSREVVSVLRKFAKEWSLPTMLPARLSKDAVMAAMVTDKKSKDGILHLALPEALGSYRLVAAVDTSPIERAIR